MPIHKKILGGILKGGHNLKHHRGGRYDLNYKPWQRQMVDPSHPAGPVKYGVYPASPAGENMLLGGLAGPSIGYRSILGRLPKFKFVRNAVKDTGGRMVPQFSRGMRRIDPKLGPPPGAVRPRAAQLRDAMRGAGGRRRVNPNEMNLGYRQQPTWPRFKGEPHHPRLTIEQLQRIMRDRVLR